MNKEFNIIMNKKQIEAINTKDGNLLIIASAGTGKTTTIVERYVNLVKNFKYGPEEIMMTTFTNKSAKDMIDKISRKIPTIPKHIGTMHSLFLKFLRDNYKETGIKQGFTLLTEDNDKKKIIKEILINLKIKPTSDQIYYFLNRINRFKNAGIHHQDLEESISIGNSTNLVKEEIDGEIVKVSSVMKNLGIKVYKEYQRKLSESNMLDFDDILLYTYKLLINNKELRNSYSNKFKAIMVDEAQDLNAVQRNILELIQNDNLCLIGDDCQNIYSWRGASNELIFKFDKKHKKIILEDNYRSNKEIIEAVNKIIKSLSFKIDKKLKCTRDKGEKIRIKDLYSFNDEIDFIVSEIKRLIKNKEELENIAILFRTNNLGKLIEREFRRNKIPCHLSRARGFLEREEIRDIIAFMRLKTNPYSRLEFERVISLIEGVGKAKIVKLEMISEKNSLPILDSLNNLGLLGLSPQIAGNLVNLHKLVKDSAKNPIGSFLKFFDYDKRLHNKYKYEPEKIKDKKENIQVLKDLFEGFNFDKEGVSAFLDSLIEMEKREKNKNKVTLSTIHSAKGLEWKHVFIAGCNDKILPFYFDSLSKIKRDDELRLFYVAVSRAKDSLTITHSNNHEWRFLQPSPFLNIIK
ncbi:MAG: Helicase, UvrD/Rep family [Parcubacteria group bacterium GW2011_GWA2_31_28]|nr:MAG: Helicase, UvrD/Rep family [Parcubacteria group bacterium GW2011_GWA2_31_28]